MKDLAETNREIYRIVKEVTAKYGIAGPAMLIFINFGEKIVSANTRITDRVKLEEEKKKIREETKNEILKSNKNTSWINKIDEILREIENRLEYIKYQTSKKGK